MGRPEADLLTPTTGPAAAERAVATGGAAPPKSCSQETTAHDSKLRRKIQVARDRHPPKRRKVGARPASVALSLAAMSQCSPRPEPEREESAPTYTPLWDTSVKLGIESKNSEPAEDFKSTVPLWSVDKFMSDGCRRLDGLRITGWGNLKFPEQHWDTATILRQWGIEPSPYRADRWRYWLKDHPDQEYVNYLCRAIVDGVPMGYRGPRTTHFSRQKALTEIQQEVLVKNLLHEREKGRLVELDVTGPWEPPFNYVMTNPVFLIPKDIAKGKWRTIDHLSFDKGRGYSVNGNILKEDFPVSFPKIDRAFEAVWRSGQGCLLWKRDLEEAYKQMLIWLEDWGLQTFKVRVPGPRLSQAPATDSGTAKDPVRAALCLIRETDQTQETLWVEHMLRDGSSCWTLPGGKIESGEHCIAAARREFSEEMGPDLITNAIFPFGGFVDETAYCGSMIADRITNDDISRAFANRTVREQEKIVRWEFVPTHSEGFDHWRRDHEVRSEDAAFLLQMQEPRSIPDDSGTPIGPIYVPVPRPLRERDRLFANCRACFGGRCFPGIFERFSSGIHWICTEVLHIPFMIHLLDDFLGVSSGPGRLHREDPMFVKTSAEMGWFDALLDDDGGWGQVRRRRRWMGKAKGPRRQEGGGPMESGEREPGMA